MINEVAVLIALDCLEAALALTRPDRLAVIEPVILVPFSSCADEYLYLTSKPRKGFPVSLMTSSDTLDSYGKCLAQAYCRYNSSSKIDDATERRIPGK